jgi:hypothetical protein
MKYFVAVLMSLVVIVGAVALCVRWIVRRSR